MKTSVARFSELNQRRVGTVGLVATALAVCAALSFSSLTALFSGSTVTADFAQTGGLQTGDDVRVSGLTVGEVKSIGLDGTHVSVQFSISRLALGRGSRAMVKTDNILGRKYLALSPIGTGRISHIPIDRTDAGISATTSLGQLATTTGRLDLDQMARSFDSLSKILNRTPEEFRAALEGVSALSRAVNKRDDQLAAILKHASSLSDVLAQRHTEISAIFSNGGAFLEELALRRHVVGQMLRTVRAATDELEGLVKDNDDTLGPALKEINGVASTLAQYRSTLEFALTNLGPYLSGLGEAVGSGPFFQAYVQNLTAPTTLTPILSDLMDGTGQ